MSRRHVATKGRWHQELGLGGGLIIGFGLRGLAGDIGPLRQRKMDGGGRDAHGGIAAAIAYAARPCEPSSDCKTARANSEIAFSVAPGASRCGECPAPGRTVTSTGQ